MGLKDGSFDRLSLYVVEGQVRVGISLNEVKGPREATELKPVLLLRIAVEEEREKTRVISMQTMRGVNARLLTGDP